MLILHGLERASAGPSDAVAYGIIYTGMLQTHEVRGAFDYMPPKAVLDLLFSVRVQQSPTVVNGAISRVEVTLFYADPTRT